VVPASWCEGTPRKTGIFDLKGCLETLGFEEIGFAPETIDGLLPALRIVGYCLRGKYQIQGRAVGFLGQLAPARLRALDCQAPVAVFEIDLSSIGLSAFPSQILPIPRFPAVTRDMAVIADQALPHASIQEVISAAREPLLVGLQLFDVFSDPEGIRVPVGQKSLAYSLTFRSAERTLTADEVNAAHARLKERLKAALSVSFRE
jgi:phenylalanyl-tRNA synthetase beta chain